MPLPLTVSCFSKTQIGLTFLVSAHLGSTGQRAVKRVSVLGGGAKFPHTRRGTFGIVSMPRLACGPHSPPYLHEGTAVVYSTLMFSFVAFGALTLLVRRQEEQLACKN